MKKKIIKKKVAKTEENQDMLDLSQFPGLKAIPIKTRKFTQFDFDFTIPNCKVEIPIIKVEDITDAIVKVNIRIMQEDLSKINIKGLDEYIRQYAYILKPIVPSIQKTRKVRIKNLNPSLKPLEAVKIWLTEKQIKNADEVYSIAEEIIRENPNEN